MTDQSLTPAYPLQASVKGTRTADGAACTLLAIRERGDTWMIHSLDKGAVRLTEEEAARMATAILHVVSPVSLTPRGPSPALTMSAALTTAELLSPDAGGAQASM